MDLKQKSDPAGYLALIKKYEIQAPAHWHESYILHKGTHQTIQSDSVTQEFFPSKYNPGPTDLDQLEFALKYDGVNLSLLSILFKSLNISQLTQSIESKQHGKYARQIWFYYEFLTNNTLSLTDLQTGSYIDLLDPKKYYTIKNPTKSSRHRINNNLLGGQDFIPLIRRTNTLNKHENLNYKQRLESVFKEYDEHLIHRAIQYLYHKETKSSFEIENTPLQNNRIERFVKVLKLAEQKDYMNKDSLIELQNQIVDARFKETNYRNIQNYIGESIDWDTEKVHYIPPSPKQVPVLMQGLIHTHNLLQKNPIHPIVHAAIIAYAFVFIHPFEDGNGRIHRFLIHHILSQVNITPKSMVFPISSTMLKHMRDYDESLEDYSKHIMPFIDYSLDSERKLTVTQSTPELYQFIDLTEQVEALFYFVNKTIETEIIDELNFLLNFDRAEEAVQSIVDLPNIDLNLLIKSIHQNNFTLSKTKHSKYFKYLSNKEIEQIEGAIKKVYSEKKEK